MPEKCSKCQKRIHLDSDIPLCESCIEDNEPHECPICNEVLTHMDICEGCAKANPINQENPYEQYGFSYKWE